RRSEVVQSLLALHADPAYLEIGVYRGETFHEVRASRKVAVDPKFAIDASERLDGSDYVERTSDDFFRDCRDTFDVIYLDGLHTFEQTLRDLLNSCERLSRDGVILIDDILPSCYPASLRDSAQAARVRQAT